MLDTLRTSLHNQLAERRTRLQRAVADSGRAHDMVALLKQVDSALHRLDEDGYVSCAVCEGEVQDELLERNPLSQYCLCELTPERQRRLEQDLNLAGRIQYGLLPDQGLVHGGWSTHFRYQPHGPVSGDYVDLVPREGNANDLFFLLGDVSGKGIAASLLMAHLNALFRSLIDIGSPIHKLVERANRIFSESTVSTHYATLVAGKAEPSGDLEICNAGHFPPLLVRRDQIIPVDSTGFPVGIFESSPYRVHRIHLAPGDSLFLYTDGLTEARDARNREYGEKRLVRSLRRNHGRSPARMAAASLRDLERFRGDVPPLDDLTVMVIQRVGTENDGVRWTKA